MGNNQIAAGKGIGKDGMNFQNLCDVTQVAHICERVKEYLERLPEDKWEVHHYKAAKLIGYEREARQNDNGPSEVRA